MARRSKTQITKEMALKIVKKLEAVIVTSSSSHDLAAVSHGDIVVATFGIRRGSRRDAGHDHVMGELSVNAAFAKDLARCPKSRQDWINEMIDQGHIARPMG